MFTEVGHDSYYRSEYLFDSNYIVISHNLWFAIRREQLQNLLEQGEKITPKQWKTEIRSLQTESDSISREKSKTATESG